MRIMIFLLLIYLGVSRLGTVEEKQVINKVNKEVEKRKIDRVLEIMEELGIRFPRVVFAQMILETGSFTSSIYEMNHNPFGMKESSRNWDSGSQKGHAYYLSLHEAMMDYCDWQKSWKRSVAAKTEEEYLDFLDNLNGKGLRYAEDPQYTNKLRVIIKKYFP